MPKYKLIYFNAKGMGETIRWIFAVSKTEYEDCRLESKDWAQEKPSESRKYMLFPHCFQYC